MRLSRLSPIAALTALVSLVLAGLMVAAPAHAAGDVGDIRINEVKTNPNPDFVELVNTGSEPVDIDGLKVMDSGGSPATIVATSTIIPAGGYYVFDPDALSGGFGLGASDLVTVLESDGTTVIDTYSWTSHRTPSASRCGGVLVNGTPATPGAANDCPSSPAWESVVINEVESNGDQVADWVELKNTGATPIDVSGWKILDGDPAHVSTPVLVPANTTIPAGGHYAIYTEIAQSPGFGLGVGDSVTLYLPDGATVVDTTTWGAHAATTWGRCPDGTGDFRETTTSTRGLANACSPIRINEIESSGGTPGDWIELKNIGDSAVDVAGWTVKDGDDANSHTLPSGTTIAAGGYLVLEEADLAFGLGADDAVRLYDDTATQIESYSWTAHAGQTYGRCKDGLGGFVDTRAPTKGAANSCPGLETQPWPGGQSVETADLAETFVQDLSGLVFDPSDPDVLWAAQNKLGTLFKLVRDEDNWVPAPGWPKNPKYTGGAGAPDTEGLTIGPDGFVYMASERNNDASGVSRNSVLRYDPAATGGTVTATDEWDLTGKIPATGANLGLEGITWVPDSFLVDSDFVDQATTEAYDPDDYPLHGTGLYVVAVENTGDLHAFALDSSGGTSHLIATIDSGFPQVADVVFDPERERLWAVTDDTHDGRTSLLEIVDGAFAVDVAYDRPVGMPNLNNEGFAIAPRSRCVDGVKEVVWSDDGDTDGHSLRRGTLDCAPAAKAASTTEAGVTATAVTAAVDSDGEPAPTGTVTFAVDGTEVGSAELSEGTATLAYVVPTGAPRTITATYAGDSKTDGSDDSYLRTDPAITAAVDGTTQRDAAGWYRGPVTIAFTCTPASAALAAACPSPVVLSEDGPDQSVTRTIVATDGGQGTVTLSGIGIDTSGAVMPRLGGRGAVGSVLSAVPGTLPAGAMVAYQWLRDGTAIPGATGAAYRLTVADAGGAISVRVTRTRAGFPTVSGTSTVIRVGGINVRRPAIRGKLKAGRKLTAGLGTWVAPGHGYRYQWLRNGKPIAGATKATYKVRKADRGKRLKVRVVAYRTGYPSVTAVSAAKRVR